MKKKQDHFQINKKTFNSQKVYQHRYLLVLRENFDNIYK